MQNPKSTFIDTAPIFDKMKVVNLEGMECRWQEIAPPKEQKKIACLLVNAIDEKSQANTLNNCNLKSPVTCDQFTEG